MMEPSQADFCHPYQPYDIQLEFMRCLYTSIETGKVAIFESPTGTGKSLSLICGALTWIRDNVRREIDGSFNNQDDDSSEDWLVAAEKATRRREFLLELAETEQKLASVRKREIARQEALEQRRALKRAKPDQGGNKQTLLNDDEFMLDDYISDDQRDVSRSSTDTLSSSTLALLNQLKPVSNNEVEPIEDRTKVIFCSRTHSQLTQFINELRRVTPPKGLPQDLSQPMLDHVSEVVKHLPLGSRKNLCINDKVSRLSSTLAINEKCLDLQKPGIAKEHKCQYLPGKDDKAKTEVFRDRAIATIRDIEDLGKLGRTMELCPYYASRSAVPLSEVLTLPYPLLLQKAAREALGVEVKDNIIVIDEAHNLMDAIADTLSISLSLAQLELATQQVIAYVQRFKHKLKGLNRMYVTQVIRLLNSFTDCLRTALTTSKTNESAITSADLMAGKGVDQVKLHKLLQYLIQSKLAYKVEGYTDAHNESTSTIQPKGILMQFQSFLSILMNPDAEGRFFASKQEADIVVRYTLLDPTEHFRDIVEKARAVILAGGTMSPMSDYADYLFSYLDPNRLSTFSFGHVIPKENMLATSITKSPAGIELDFTFGKRSSDVVISELGDLVVRICRIVPDGVVVFFPSYDYLAQVTNSWNRSNETQSILTALSATKRVFEEVRGVSSEELLRDYAHCIDEGGGAIMLSVVGGKLSEGINFSDKLGRAVIAVGLPFPNMHSPEWKAKIDHIEQTRYKRCREIDGLLEDQSRLQSKAAGREFYENACMRAVNQSIGRAIRHKNDFAAILLVDRRFATTRIQQKLPQWIRGSMKRDGAVHSWSMIERDLRAFFQVQR